MSEYKKSGGFGGNRGGGDRGSRHGFGGGKPSFNRGGGDRGGRSSQMFSAVCDECNKSCEVPFRPSGEKPVYCSNCFGAKREGGSNDHARKDFGRREEKSYESKPVFAEKKNDDNKIHFDAINAKLDKLISLLSKNNTPTVLAKVEKKASPVIASFKKEVKEVKKALSPVKKEIKKDVKKVVAVSKKAVAKIVSKNKPVAKKKK